MSEFAINMLYYFAKKICYIILFKKKFLKSIKLLSKFFLKHKVTFYTLSLCPSQLKSCYIIIYIF